MAQTTLKLVSGNAGIDKTIIGCFLNGAKSGRDGYPVMLPKYMTKLQPMFNSNLNFF